MNVGDCANVYAYSRGQDIGAEIGSWWRNKHECEQAKMLNRIGIIRIKSIKENKQ